MDQNPQNDDAGPDVSSVNVSHCLYRRAYVSGGKNARAKTLLNNAQGFDFTRLRQCRTLEPVVVLMARPSIPAKAGIQQTKMTGEARLYSCGRIPAFAGMSGEMIHTMRKRL